MSLGVQESVRCVLEVAELGLFERGPDDVPVRAQATLTPRPVANQLFSAQTVCRHERVDDLRPVRLCHIVEKPDGGLAGEQAARPPALQPGHCDFSAAISQVQPYRQPHSPSAMKVSTAIAFSLTVERSHFYALLAPLADPAEIDRLLKERRRDYRKAVHHCWAYRIGSTEVSKDDGEVGHPGRVLLELLRKYDLEGALLVSRIFGGVKLGVGGVSRAFRDAGQGAINAYLAQRR